MAMLRAKWKIFRKFFYISMWLLLLLLLLYTFIYCAKKQAEGKRKSNIIEGVREREREREADVLTAAACYVV